MSAAYLWLVFISSYMCQARLVHNYITNKSLVEAALFDRLSSRKGLMGASLQVQSKPLVICLISKRPENSEEDKIYIIFMYLFDIFMHQGLNCFLL